MADDKDKIVKLEERLEKATVTFKEMKVQLDDKIKENEILKTRVAELEDELVINGNSKEEIEGLKARLEKAKEIFTTQKSKIAEVTELNNTHVARIVELESMNNDLTTELKNLNEAYEGLCNKFEQIKNVINN